MKKLFLILIKFIPVIQLTGMLLNNTLYCFNVIKVASYIIDFIIGNSVITTFLLFVCSYLFNFCKWHRLIITANFINMMIANYDALFGIPITDIQLLSVYYIIAAVFIIVSTHIHIKQNKNEHKNKSIKRYSCGIYRPN